MRVILLYVSFFGGRGSGGEGGRGEVQGFEVVRCIASVAVCERDDAPLYRSTRTQRQAPTKNNGDRRAFKHARTHTYIYTYIHVHVFVCACTDETRVRQKKKDREEVGTDDKEKEKRTRAPSCIDACRDTD